MPPSQPGGFQPGAVQYGAAPATSQNNGMAVASLVVGIIGLLTFWACGGGGLLGVVAVVLGVLGMNKAKEMNDNGKGLAIGGIVTGALAIIASVLVVIFWFVLADDINDSFDEINSDPSDGVCNEDRFLQDPDC